MSRLVKSAEFGGDNGCRTRNALLRRESSRTSLVSRSDDFGGYLRRQRSAFGECKDNDCVVLFHSILQCKQFIQKISF